MPPAADQKLQERILTAAHKLWREHGEKGLTLRGVARAAGTTTPTVYKRFKNKEAIQLALAARFREKLYAELFSSTSVEDIARRFLAFAEANPFEYSLLHWSWAELFLPERPRPARVWMSTQIAARFGGSAEDYEEVVDALFLLCHGTCTLLTIAKDPSSKDVMRRTCLDACDRIIEHCKLFRTRK